MNGRRLDVSREKPGAVDRRVPQGKRNMGQRPLTVGGGRAPGDGGAGLRRNRRRGRRQLDAASRFERGDAGAVHSGGASCEVPGMEPAAGAQTHGVLPDPVPLPHRRCKVMARRTPARWPPARRAQRPRRSRRQREHDQLLGLALGCTVVFLVLSALFSWLAQNLWVLAPSAPPRPRPRPAGSTGAGRHCRPGRPAPRAKPSTCSTPSPRRAPAGASCAPASTETQTPTPVRDPGWVANRSWGERE